MRTLELRQLRYFVEVAEREHISEAAEHLHVAQSAISRQIANLEEELGTPLFERIGRNVKLTPIGKIFLEHAITALKAIDFAAKQVEEYLNPEKCVPAIGCPPIKRKPYFSASLNPVSQTPRFVPPQSMTVAFWEMQGA